MQYYVRSKVNKICRFVIFPFTNLELGIQNMQYFVLWKATVSMEFEYSLGVSLGGGGELSRLVW